MPNQPSIHPQQSVPAATGHMAGGAPFLILCVMVTFATSLKALDPAKSVFQFNCRSWTRVAGLPADKISAVVQTADGYIWLGGQNGLIRFDGQTFHVLPINLPEAQGQGIMTMQRAGHSAVWFSIREGGYGSYDGRKFLPIGDGRWNAPGTNSNVIMVARDGAIWTGSVYGWGRWMEGKPEDTAFDDSLGPVITLYEAPGGRIWIGTALCGLYYWEDGEIKLFPDEDLKLLNIHSIVQDPAGDLWVGTGAGLYRYDAQFNRKDVFFTSSQTNALLVDQHGILWIGTNESGLRRHQDGKFSLLRKTDGLSSDTVTSLLEDDEGSLWIGTVEGLSQLSDLKFPIYSDKEGLAAGAALTVAASPQGGLWIGTSRGGASHFNGHTVTNHSDSSLFPNRYVRRILVARNGDVYFGDGSRNISVMSAGLPVARYNINVWPEAFAEDATSVLAGIGPDLYRIQNGRLEPYPFSDAAPYFEWFNSLHVSGDGAIWAGTRQGLFRIMDGKVTRWSTADGLSSNRVHFVFEDVDGSIWGGLPTGMFRIRDSRVTSITMEDGLPDGRIYSIVPDDHGSFWMASGRGILRTTRLGLTDFAEGRSRRIECDIFDGLESVKFTDRTDQAYTACKTSDGRIWFPNPRGVVMVDPVGYFTNRVPPRVYVQKVRAGDRDLTGEVSATATAGTRRIEFFFTALSYIAPEKLRVRYQLQGIDPSWIDAGSQRSAAYNNLKAGRYDFVVQAANADGVWNTAGGGFSVVLPPRFYERFWFYGACGIAAGFILLGSYRWKVRHMRKVQERLQRENDALEAQVRQRTNELAGSLSLLKATLDSTADGILSIRLSDRQVSYNRQFSDMWRIPTDLADKATHAELRAVIRPLVKDPVSFDASIERMFADPEAETFDLFELRDERVFERYCKPQRLDDRSVGVVINYRDVTERKRAELAIAEGHKQLLNTSRLAGMAEVATNVLHNVGNVLNSVNVSATVVSEKMRTSKTRTLPKISAMFQEHATDLGAFLTLDPKGKLLPAYIATLSDQLLAEQAAMTGELDHLKRNIEHIKDIVAMQQGFARVAGVTEPVPLTELLENALQISESERARLGIELIRDYQFRPVLTVERHKVMQILVNLITNAQQACGEVGGTGKRITVQTTLQAGFVRIAVVDNGVGILAENLTRIFNQGFTTRKHGHGFGLHGAALLAKEIGGSLNGSSAGPGQGATFILELPHNGVLTNDENSDR